MKLLDTIWVLAVVQQPLKMGKECMFKKSSLALWMGVMTLGFGVTSLAVAAEPANTLGEVTVETTRRGIEKKADDFIESFVPKTDASIARWREPVCPLVAGLPKAQAEYVLARLSKNWTDAGVPLGGEQCDVNAFIIFTADPELFLTKWQHKSGRLYGEAYPQMIKRFKSDAHAIKVWANKGHHQGGGSDSSGDDANTGLGQSFAGAREARLYSATRLEFPELTDLDSTIAMVDPKKLIGTPLSAVADYLSIAMAVEVRNDREFSKTGSILNLMGPEDGRLPEWTPWDKAFLTAVYKADLRQTTQFSVVGSHMAAEILKPIESSK